MTGWSRPGPGRAPTRRDHVLDEWDTERHHVSFREFPAVVGMTYEAWERMYFRARKAGDPRAVRRQASGRWAA